MQITSQKSWKSFSPYNPNLYIAFFIFPFHIIYFQWEKLIINDNQMAKLL